MACIGSLTLILYTETGGNFEVERPYDPGYKMVTEAD